MPTLRPVTATAAGTNPTAIGVVAVIVAVAAVLLTPSPARAHGAIAPAEAPAGVATDFTLTIPHGCAPGEPPPAPGEEVAPTIEIALRLPPGATLENAAAPTGWNADPSSAEGRDIIAWSGGRLAPDDVGRFTFTATLYGDEDAQVPLEVFQGCTEGAYRWVEVEGADEDGEGDPLEQPAPLVRLTSTAAAPDAAPGDDRDPAPAGAAGEGDDPVGGGGTGGSDGGSGTDVAPTTAPETGDAAAAGETPTGETPTGEALAGDAPTDGAAAGDAAAGGTRGDEDASGDGPSTAVWVVGGLVVAAAAAAAAAAVRRSRSGTTAADRDRGGAPGGTTGTGGTP